MVKNLCSFLLIFTTVSLIATKDEEKALPMSVPMPSANESWHGCCVPFQPICSDYPPQDKVQCSLCILIGRLYQTETYNLKNGRRVHPCGIWPWFNCQDCN